MFRCSRQSRRSTCSFGSAIFRRGIHFFLNKFRIFLIELFMNPKNISAVARLSETKCYSWGRGGGIICLPFPRIFISSNYVILSFKFQVPITILTLFLGIWVQWESLPRINKFFKNENKWKWKMKKMKKKIQKLLE